MNPVVITPRHIGDRTSDLQRPLYFAMNPAVITLRHIGDRISDLQHPPSILQ
jgi:hypothetical protein